MAHQASPKVTGHKDELLPQLMSLSIEVIMILGDSIFVPFSISTSDGEIVLVISPT
jgi:hypothetical protein